MLGAIRWLVRSLAGALRNLMASFRRKGLDYVVLRLEGPYTERRDLPPPLPFPFGQLPLFLVRPSLEGLREAFETLAQDRRVRGVVLRVGDLAAGPATVQALRDMVSGLRQHGKEVVCWLPFADTWPTYLASACDRVILPESGTVYAAGLRAEVTFLKDTLALIGVEADFEALREYKVGPDLFRRSSMSEAHREMLDAILDADFDELVQGISEGRGLEQQEVRQLVDQMPLSAREAVEAKLADAVLYEDELADELGQDGQAASLVTWREARRWLRHPIRWRRRPAIGVVSVEGTIVVGKSRQLPPLPFPLPLVERLAGSETVTQALRAAERDRRIEAVILHVESPGGSDLGSDLIWREVRRLRERKPVVALLGDRATSGGYYVCASASAIVAQPVTLTGSIGIWGGKFVTAGLYERLRASREVLQRGGRAGLYGDTAPFTEEERRAVRQSLEMGYERFKSRVAEGRGIESAEVERIAQGRVWTGRQALELGLADELGGFDAALRRAKVLAGLDPERRYPVVTVTAPRAFHMPLPPSSQEGVLMALAEALRVVGRERVWALPPWMIWVRG